jgi:hypothetical protein
MKLSNEILRIGLFFPIKPSFPNAVQATFMATAFVSAKQFTTSSTGLTIKLLGICAVGPPRHSFLGCAFQISF